MKIFRFIATSTLAATLIVAFAACASDSRAGDSVVTTPTTVEAATAPVPTHTGVFADAQSAACEVDLAAVRTAVEMHVAINGDAQIVEAQLVEDGVLTEESLLHDVGPENSVVASPTGGCID